MPTSTRLPQSLAPLLLRPYDGHAFLQPSQTNPLRLIPTENPLDALLFAIGGVGIALVALTMFRIYGVETHHKSRNSIWWTERGKNLIPPTATDIALQQDLLDHYATYTVSEKDLNAFLDKRFARNGKAIDSFSDRSQVDPAKVGKPIGRLGWNVSKETVVYEYAASNGGVHTYYHDPSTGRTYQSSAYW